MKLWLSKSTEVPLQEQLSAQIVLGIVSADLSPGERLPSSAQLARRFHIHPNTVRLAYRGLARDGWIEWKPGNGFFVRDPSREMRDRESANAEQLIAAFFDAANRMGVSPREIQSRFVQWLAVKPPSRVVVIEADPELRKILVSEIQDSLESRVQGIRPDQLQRSQFKGVLLAALDDRPARVGMHSPLERPFVRLRSNSISAALAQEGQPPPGMMITVMSMWPGFLERARATLAAVGFDPARLELRQGGLSDVKRRLATGNLVVADSLLGRRLPPHPRLRVFRIISNESLERLRNGLRK